MFPLALPVLLDGLLTGGGTVGTEEEGDGAPLPSVFPLALPVLLDGLLTVPLPELLPPDFSVFATTGPAEPTWIIF